MHSDSELRPGIDAQGWARQERAGRGSRQVEGHGEENGEGEYDYGSSNYDRKNPDFKI